jgi:hypothetical protein
MARKTTATIQTHSDWAIYFEPSMLTEEIMKYLESNENGNST